LYPKEMTTKNMDEVTIPNSGFLVVKSYESLLSSFSRDIDTVHQIYAIPKRKANVSGVFYNGLDRDALDSYKNSKILSEIRLNELEIAGDYLDGFLWSIDHAKEVHGYLENESSNYEIIWTRLVRSKVEPPEEFESIGFEATYFVSDHFSPSCDCMMFPRWHGTDREGELFKKYFRRLNSKGLFTTSDEAKDFLEYYLTFDWTETGEYEIAEVFQMKGI